MRIMQMAYGLVALTTAGCLGSTDEDGCPLTDPRGEVTLEAFTGGGWDGLRVTLHFQRTVHPREAAQCTQRTVGACTITRCTNVGVDFVNGEPTCPGATAGTVRITREGSATLSTNTGTQFTLSTPPRPGERFTVSADGAIVPAFSGRVALPQALRVTAPTALSSGGGLTLDDSAPLTVRWMPVADTVVLTARGTNGGTYTAECSFAGSLGEGTIPSDALPTDVTSVEASTRAESRIMAGAYPITLRAAWPASARSLVSRPP